MHSSESSPQALSRPSVNRAAGRRYLIIGSARSGTTAIHLAVLGHPNAAGLVDELKIDPLLTQGRYTFTRGRDPKRDRDCMLPAVYDALTTLNSDSDTQVHGAKVVCNSVKMARRLVSVLQQQLPDIKIILIRRRDLVAQFGSGLIGRSTGVMHAWNPGAKDRQIEPIHIDRWQLTAFAAGRLRTYDVLDTLSTSHDLLGVDYESLLNEPDDLYRSLYRFLGLPEMQPDWMAAKKVLPPPDRYIRNYAAMRERLRAIERGEINGPELLMCRALAETRRRLRLIGG
jgi:LPS sulfotransferase NodH